MSRKLPSSPRGSLARIEPAASRPFARIANGALAVVAWVFPMLPAVRINLDMAMGQGTAWTSFAIASIAFSAICIEITISSAESRHFLRIALYGTLGALFLALNVANAIGNAASHSDGSRDDRSSQIARKQRLETILAASSQARKAQFEIAGDATPEGVTSEIQAAKAADAKRWNASGECDVSKISAGPTRVFCEAIAKLQAKLAAAKKRDELDAKIAELSKEDGGVAPSSLDPFADNIARAIGLIGYTVDENGKVLIATSRDWAKAVGVELMAAFGPTALLLMMAGMGRKHEAPARTVPAASEKPARPQRPTGTDAAEGGTSKPAVIAALPSDAGDDDAMIAFIARRLERCDGATMKAGDLFQLWGEDCAELGIDASSQKAFSVRVRRFFEHDPNHGRPKYRNVQRKTAQPAIRMVVNN